MNMGRLPGTGHIERIVFNEHGEVRREQLLNDLQQRIRYIGQGPDGLLYLLTDEADGVVLRIEPAQAAAHSQAGPPEAGPPEAHSAVPAGEASEPLFARYDCSTCHDIDSRRLGPAYEDIAARYAITEENIELLAGRIIEGSVGVWGETPMASHSGIERDDAMRMAERILALDAGVAE